MLSLSKKAPSRRAAPNRHSINDQNMSPFHPSSEISLSMHHSEPPSSPLVSNSFLYNLPDPTLNLPATSTTPTFDIFTSPSKRSAIASLNKPLSHQQTQHLQPHKTNAAPAHLQAPASAPRSPSKPLSPGSISRLQARLDAPGGLPTPPSSSEALTTTPGPSKLALAPLPQEPVSPSPSRTRNAILSPTRASPSKASRPPTTPRSSQRGSASRLLSSGNDDDTDDDDILRSANAKTPPPMQLLREIEEDSDEEEEEEDQEEEIQLISFKRGGPDATFVREIKENGWDQPLPPSPIKFTYLEPVAPRPPRQSSVASRASSQSRSKTPQLRASPAPSHASTSRVSHRARSIRASSAVAVEESQDLSIESIKSSDSTLTNISKLSQACNKTAESGRVSIARSSAPPPAIVADLTRDHPSLPDSPGDDPLLLTGPDTYIVYHHQTPSARNRSTWRLSKASAGHDASLSFHSHSTPLPSTGPAAALSQRRDSAGSDSSMASRSSLYARMSGRVAEHGSSAVMARGDESGQTEIPGPFNDEEDHEEEDDGAPFMAFNDDDAGFASDSDDEQVATTEIVATGEDALQQQQEAEKEGLEDVSSMSYVSRSFADESAPQEKGDGAADSSDSLDDSIVDQSMQVDAVDASVHDEINDSIPGADQSEEVGAHDQTLDTSAGDPSANDESLEKAADVSLRSTNAGALDDSEELHTNDVSTTDETADLSERVEAEEDLSAVDRSVDVSMVDSAVAEESDDVNEVEQSILVDSADQSMDASGSAESEEATSADEQEADTSLALDNVDAADQTGEQDESMLDSSFNTSKGADEESFAAADTSIESDAAQEEAYTSSVTSLADSSEMDHSAAADATVDSAAPQEASDSSTSSLTSLTPSSEADESYPPDESTHSIEQPQQVPPLAAEEASFESSKIDKSSEDDELAAADDEEPFEHSLSVAGQAHDESVANASTSTLDQKADSNEVERSQQSQVAPETSAKVADNSMDLDFSMIINAPDASGENVFAAPDGDLLPHPVVLIEAVEASSINLAGPDTEIRRGLVDGIDVSLSRQEAGEISVPDVSMSIAIEDDLGAIQDSSPPAPILQPAVQEASTSSTTTTAAAAVAAVAVDDLVEEEVAMHRSDSISSELSSISFMSAAEQDEEALRQKYTSSRDTLLPDRSRTMIRRLSLSTDSELDSDADQDSEDEEELQDAGEQSASSRHRASQSKRARSLVEDDVESGESDEEEDDGSAIDEEGASSGEEEEEEEEEDDEDEDEDEDELSEGEEEDEDDEDASSRLDEDERNASVMEPVVILSSSASSSVASTASIRTPSIGASSGKRRAPPPDSESSSEDDEGFVVLAVHNSRDRSSARRLEHSAALHDEEPQIHTLHLRQPAPRLSTTTNNNNNSALYNDTTLADTSHSRSRVLKLGQATSTPIVEISSLDPRAAARATAILKLFHKYVDEGWLSGVEMGDSTEGQMRRVVDAIRRVDDEAARRRGGDASVLHQDGEGGGEGEDLTTLLMDAELGLAREGSVDAESFLESRATSVASTTTRGMAAGMTSPATPFLPGGFRATPASIRANTSAAEQTDSPSINTAASCSTATINDTLTISRRNNLLHRPLETFTFPTLSTPDRSSTRRSRAKQARLSLALVPPALPTFSPRMWDTKDWVRLDKYFTSGVKSISSVLLSPTQPGDKVRKARCYVDALFGVNVAEVAELFLAEMQIPQDKQVGEWSSAKVQVRLEALQRKYLRKVERKYPDALTSQGQNEGVEREEDSMATEDLEWSLGGNTTSTTTTTTTTMAAPVKEGGGRKGGGRVSFGTPYRTGAHSTPAVGLLKKATSRAQRERVMVQEKEREREREGLYPALPSSSRVEKTMEGEGVMTKASRLISRLSGSFGSLLASPRAADGQGKGKRKATEADMSSEAVRGDVVRRRVAEAESFDDDESSRDSSSMEGEDSLLSITRVGGMTSTINASLLTNATSIHPSTSSTSHRPLSTAKSTTTTASRGARVQTRIPAATATRTQPTASASTSASIIPQPQSTAARTGFTSSLQLAGGSSGVSHTPLSLLSPGTHRTAARKVDELRQSRAQRNWTSPRRQRLLASATTSIRRTATSQADLSTCSTPSAGSTHASIAMQRSGSSSSLAEFITSSAATQALVKRSSRRPIGRAIEGSSSSLRRR